MIENPPKGGFFWNFFENIQSKQTKDPVMEVFL